MQALYLKRGDWDVHWEPPAARPDEEAEEEEAAEAAEAFAVLGGADMADAVRQRVTLAQLEQVDARLEAEARYVVRHAPPGRTPCLHSESI